MNPKKPLEQTKGHRPFRKDAYLVVDSTKFDQDCFFPWQDSWMLRWLSQTKNHLKSGWIILTGIRSNDLLK